MELRGERVVLRPWEPGDEQPLVALADDRRVWRNLADRFPHPYTRLDAEQWIRAAGSPSRDALHLAIVAAEEIVGGIGLTRLPDLQRLTAEIGYWVGVPYWNRGFATEALGLASEAAWRHYDFVRLQASVLERNEASKRVLEKAGYALEARLRRHSVKDGRVCDTWLYVRLREVLGGDAWP